MARPAVFAIAERKLLRARREMDRLAASAAASERVGFDDEWSRTAAIAFAVHGAYTGLEDIMLDIARVVDDFVPQGPASHQDLLDQMRAPLPGRRPALLDDQLYPMLVELKSFRHLVRHQYGIDLIPSRAEANGTSMVAALSAFERALATVEAALSRPD